MSWPSNYRTSSMEITTEYLALEISEALAAVARAKDAASDAMAEADSTRRLAETALEEADNAERTLNSLQSSL